MHEKNGVQYYGKDIETLDVNGLLDELEHQRDHNLRCREMGQGISSKEAVYYRQLKTKLRELSPEEFVRFEEETERMEERYA